MPWRYGEARRGMYQYSGIHLGGIKEDNAMSEWRIIPGFSNYAVSDRKQVKNLSTGKKVGHRNMHSSAGARDVALLRSDAGDYKLFTIERLFGMCFGYQPPAEEGEVWKDSIAPGIMVSNRGRVYSTWNQNVMTPQRKRGKDYLYVRDRERRRWPVHRLVAFAFVDGRDMFRDCIDHINEDKSDNRVENLRWCTREENNEFYMMNHPERMKR